MEKNAFGEDIKGLCGNFDDINNNDFVGPDNIQLTSFMKAAEKWADEICATPEDSTVSQCSEVHMM